MAQPFDTLLFDYTHIEDITPLDDGTFIIIGDERGAVTVSRITSKAENIWKKTFTGVNLYGVREFEVHTEENDSSIQIITYKLSCNIIVPGTGFLFTLNFDGSIKDSIGIPFETGYGPIFILSGKDLLPRCAIVLGDSVILKYANGNFAIIDDTIDFIRPLLVDMSPSGKLIIHYDFGFEIRQLNEGKYVPVSWGYATPDTRRMIYAEDNKIVLLKMNYITVIDTHGHESNSFHRSGVSFYELKWKKPYLYVECIGYMSDTSFAFDLGLNMLINDAQDPEEKYIYLT